MRHKQLTTVNRVFREWTHGVNFTLMLGKTQVGALVSVHASQEERHFVGSGHRLHRRFVQGVHGLEERGLVIHHPEKLGQYNNLGEIFEVTSAGLGVNCPAPTGGRLSGGACRVPDR